MRSLWSNFLLLVLFTVGTGTMVCQDLKREPSLEATTTFMNDVLASQGDSFTRPYACWSILFQSSPYIFAVPENLHLIRNEINHTEDYGYDWHAFVLNPGIVKFDLQEVDPTSIYSKGVASADYISKHEVDERTKDFAHSDLWFVTFTTRNAKKTVEHGSIPDRKEGEKVEISFDTKSDGGIIVLDLQEKAERFVTAFKRAVVLCGGKSSDFDRTPSKE